MDQILKNLELVECLAKKYYEELKQHFIKTFVRKKGYIQIEDVNDAIQISFEKLIVMKKPLPTDEKKAKYLLMSIIKHSIIDIYRKKKNYTHLPIDNANNIAIQEQKTSTSDYKEEIIEFIIQKLNISKNHTYIKIIRLRLNGLSIKEIIEETGYTVNYIYKLNHKIRTAIKKQLTKDQIASYLTIRQENKQFLKQKQTTPK